VGPPFRLIPRFQRLKTQRGYTFSWGDAPGFFIARPWRLSLKIFTAVVRLLAIHQFTFAKGWSMKIEVPDEAMSKLC